MPRISYVQALKARGFDTSHAWPFGRGWHIGCSQCEALVINGVPAHESGCLNQVHTCHGCDAQVVARPGAYCPTCQ